MKKYRNILILANIILMIINISYMFISNYHNYNTNIKLNEPLTNYDYYAYSSKINGELAVDKKESLIKDLNFEKSIIEFAKEITENLFNNTIDKYDYMNKYFIRKPYTLFGDDNHYNENSNYEFSKQYLENLKEELTYNTTYNGIKQIYLNNYADNYVVEVELNDFINNNKIIKNFKIEYQIIKEDTSRLLKIESIIYYDNPIINYTFDNQTDYNVYYGYNEFNNAVKIELFDNEKKIDEASGFFVNDKTIITVFDILDDKRYDEKSYVITDSFSKKYNIVGLISFSKKYNIAILRLKETNYNYTTNMYNSIRNIGSNIKVLTSENTTYEGKVLSVTDNLIRSNIKLKKENRGSALLNSNNQIIGINTRINDDSAVYTLTNDLYNRIIINIGTFDKNYLVNLNDK